MDIDDDVLIAAKELAATQKKTAGRVLSQLARSGLCRHRDDTRAVRNGFELLPGPSNIVTAEQVEKLLEESL